MGIETILYTVLAAAVVAVPIVVVLGTAVLLAVGGVIGCTKCAMSFLGEKELLPARRTAERVGPRFA